MSNTTVTEKLETLNVSKNVILEKLELCTEQLQEHKKKITQYQSAIKQLEAEANSLVGAISVCNELLKDEEDE